MECKYDPMQSKIIAEVQLGSHAFPFTLIILKFMFIDYTHICIYYVTQLITDS